MTVGMVILDASVAIKAILPNPQQSHCLAWVETFADAQLAAPALWSYETTATLAKLVHFKEISQGEGQQGLEKLDALSVTLFVPDAEQSRAAFEWTLRLKRASAYDSYYLALAESLECDFWTADSRLYNALAEARPERVRWIEELPRLEE